MRETPLYPLRTILPALGFQTSSGFMGLSVAQGAWTLSSLTNRDCPRKTWVCRAPSAPTMLSAGAGPC